MEYDFFDLLVRADGGAARAEARPVQVTAGQVLFQVGEHPQWVYFPRDCLLSLTLLSEDGDVCGLNLVGVEGQAGGAEAALNLPSYTACTVQISGEALRLPAERFRQIVHADPRRRDLLDRYGAVALAEAQQWGVCAMRHRVESRYAEKLVKAAERSGHLKSLPITQQSLSMLLGVQRTTVTAIAASLQTRGVIYNRRGGVDIRDIGALRHLACGCRGDLLGYQRKVLGAYVDAPLASV